MKRKFGTICMFLGTALVVAALSLFLWNRWEDRRAGAAAAEIMTQLEAEMASGSSGSSGESDPYSTQMTEVEIDGHMYIGYISIPSLDIELPVMSDWNYDQLQIAPCRYYGSTKTRDLVIAAHNYTRHFGPIRRLSPGDDVYFTDMDGVTTAYQVAEVDTLNPTAVEQMTSSGYALTLFTCTYGGQSRVTVRCDAVSD